jgi:D-alanyl-D-alanine carboxypeptidase
MWMARNAHLYGFVLSYPRGESDVTCYAYEPWHYRYFGRGMATRIHESGLTVREYLWNVDKGFIRP